MKAPFLIGRLMFGGFFLYNGINHFLNVRDLAQYAGAKHVPKPDIAIRVTGAILGIKPKYGAAAIIAFLASVSPMIHNFWSEEDPQARQADMINFGKNLALLGGALALSALDEPWPASVPVAQPTLMDRAKKTAWKVLAA
jgi:uncharacterized membrane protein YphA (DoxX/SURF4 family)